MHRSNELPSPSPRVTCFEKKKKSQPADFFFFFSKNGESNGERLKAALKKTA